MVDFNAVLLRHYIERIGLKETSRNRGPEINKYHESVGLDPAGEYPWCTDMAYYLSLLTSEELNVKNPFPRTAKAVRAWELLFKLGGESNPAPGYLYFLSHGKAWKIERYTDSGHMGIIRRATTEVWDIDEISGNTNRAGSREGDSCWEHHGAPEVTHGGTLLGYVNLNRVLAAM